MTVPLNIRLIENLKGIEKNDGLKKCHMNDMQDFLSNDNNAVSVKLL